MSIELTCLILSALLTLVAVVAQGMAAAPQVGSDYLMGPRDEERPRTGVAARLRRACANHVEWQPYFIAAVLAVELSGRHSTLTASCAIAYVIARSLYIPAYAIHIPFARTAIFGIATLAATMMLMAPLF